MKTFEKLVLKMYYKTIVPIKRIFNAPKRREALRQYKKHATMSLAAHDRMVAYLNLPHYMHWGKNFDKYEQDRITWVTNRDKAYSYLVEWRMLYDAEYPKYHAGVNV
jgi:hypothetical protein